VDQRHHHVAADRAHHLLDELAQSAERQLGQMAGVDRARVGLHPGARPPVESHLGRSPSVPGGRFDQPPSVAGRHVQAHLAEAGGVSEQLVERAHQLDRRIGELRHDQHPLLQVAERLLLDGAVVAHALAAPEVERELERDQASCQPAGHCPARRRLAGTLDRNSPRHRRRGRHCGCAQLSKARRQPRHEGQHNTHTRPFAGHRHRRRARPRRALGVGCAG
jgi:hypothetical protein